MNTDKTNRFFYPCSSVLSAVDCFFEGGHEYLREGEAAKRYNGRICLTGLRPSLMMCGWQRKKRDSASSRRDILWRGVPDG